MNIKFEEIIERANARKLALEDFSNHLQGLAEATSELDEALSYFEILGEKSKALDAEAKEMLNRVPLLAQLVARACNSTRRSLLKDDVICNIRAPLLVLNVEANQ